MRLSAPLYLFDQKDSSLKVVPLGSDPFMSRTPLCPEPDLPKQTHFFSTQPMIEEGGEERPVPLVLDCVPPRRFEQHSGLDIAQCRRLPFIRSLARPFHIMI